MNKTLQGELTIVEIQDTKKIKTIKEGKKTIKSTVENRRVVIVDNDNTFKITLTQERGFHPLDELTKQDLWAEVDINLNILLKSRQKKLTDLPEEE